MIDELVHTAERLGTLNAILALDKTARNAAAVKKQQRLVRRLSKELLKEIMAD